MFHVSAHCKKVVKKKREKIFVFGLAFHCSYHVGVRMVFTLFLNVLEASLSHFNLNKSKCVFALESIADFNLYFLATGQRSLVGCCP